MANLSKNNAEGLVHCKKTSNLLLKMPNRELETKHFLVVASLYCQKQ